MCRAGRLQGFGLVQPEPCSGLAIVVQERGAVEPPASVSTRGQRRRESENMAVRVEQIARQAGVASV